MFVYVKGCLSIYDTRYYTNDLQETLLMLVKGDRVSGPAGLGTMIQRLRKFNLSG